VTRPRRAITKWKARALASEDRAHRTNMIHHAVEMVIALHAEEGHATVTITRHRPGGDDVRVVEVGR
jgi:hypothetical protein